MISFLRELIEFFAYRKKLWLLPIVFVMLVVGALLFFTQGTVFAPFIYALF